MDYTKNFLFGLLDPRILEPDFFIQKSGPNSSSAFMPLFPGFQTELMTGTARHHRAVRFMTLAGHDLNFSFISDKSGTQIKII
jgi:hypothetical protein